MLMQKIMKYTAISAVFSCFSLVAMAETNETFDPNKELVDQTMSAYMAKAHVPGAAVVLYVKGQPHTYYYGYANPEKQYKVSSYTVFEMGSISKVMTAILFAQEIDWANMALNDSVKKYLKDLPNGFSKVTLGELATHTSGLPLNPPKNVTNEEKLKQYLSSWSTENTPGAEWIYSNTGMTLLGDALEKSTGKTYDFLYRRHIIIPLGMHDVGVNVPENLKKFYAQGFNEAGQPVPPYEAGILTSAGGLKTTPADMQIFLKAAIGLPGTPERVFYPMRMTQTGYVRLPNSFQGLGWEIHSLEGFRAVNGLLDPSAKEWGPIDVNGLIDKPTYTGNALIDKTGATTGFRSYIAVIPGKNAGIVILTNRSSIDSSIVKAGREILFKATHLA